MKALVTGSGCLIRSECIRLLAATPVEFGAFEMIAIFRVIYGLGIAYVGLITLPLPFESVKPGLDEFWTWALNAIPGCNSSSVGMWACRTW